MTHGEMIRMRRVGFTYREIAAKAGIPWGTVRSRLRAWGVKPEVVVIHRRRRPMKYCFPRWLLQEMYWACSLSTVEIGYELDIPDTSVAALLRWYGIPTRSRSEAQKLYVVRNPQGRRPRGANREQAMRASAISAERRRMRAKKNRQRRERKARQAAAA